MPRAPAPHLAYSTALLRLWSAVHTGRGCVGCDLTDVRHPGCACPCHEAEALLRATGVLREPAKKGGVA